MTWRYSVRLWYVSPNTKEVDYLSLNWFLSQVENKKLTKDGYLTGNGVGTERSFQVAYDLGSLLGSQGFTDPKNADRPNGYQFTRYTLTA